MQTILIYLLIGFYDIIGICTALLVGSFLRAVYIERHYEKEIIEETIFIKQLYEGSSIFFYISNNFHLLCRKYIINFLYTIIIFNVYVFIIKRIGTYMSILKIGIKKYLCFECISSVILCICAFKNINILRHYIYTKVIFYKNYKKSEETLKNSTFSSPLFLV